MRSYKIIIMKKIFKKFRLLLVISAIALSALITVSFDDNTNFEIAKDLDVYYTLFRELNLYYVDETRPGELIRKSIDAMLNSLDPYTVFIPESQMEDFRFMTTGQYGGIGALIRKEGDYVVITEPYEGFPAQKNDIIAGDVILEIDGQSINGKSTSDVSEMLKGQPKTSLTITLRRPGKSEHIIKTITREEIKIENVSYSGVVADSIGYINLSNFTEGAYNDVRKAFAELKEKHKITSLILDLRGNPGGLLIEAVGICNMFVPKSELIVSTKGKIKDWDKNYLASQQPLDINIPVVVLVNSGSASASEIVAGAMQDIDRGIVIGSRTFGKGLVQTTRPLSYNAKLKVTTAKYYTPTGRCIQALDYTHRNPDGSVGKIPDSLITEFKTRNGRKVYDGGGITPDISLQPEQLGNLALSLYSKNLIFDFATQYYLKEKNIPPAGEFEITENIYQDFVNYLEGKDYNYQTKSEEELEILIETVKEEKYEDIVKEELDALKRKLAHDRKKDLQIFKPELKRLLSEEIASRYYYQKGRMQAILKDDPAMEQAISVLKNRARYNEILNKK